MFSNTLDDSAGKNEKELTIEKYLNLTKGDQSTLEYQLLKVLWPMMLTVPGQGQYFSIYDILVIAQEADANDFWYT